MPPLAGRQLWNLPRVLCHVTGARTQPRTYRKCTGHAACQGFCAIQRLDSEPCLVASTAGRKFLDYLAEVTQAKDASPSIFHLLYPQSSPNAQSIKNANQDFSSGVCMLGPPRPRRRSPSRFQMHGIVAEVAGTHLQPTAPTCIQHLTHGSQASMRAIKLTLFVSPWINTGRCSGPDRILASHNVTIPPFPEQPRPPSQHCICNTLRILITPQLFNSRFQDCIVSLS